MRNACGMRVIRGGPTASEREAFYAEILEHWGGPVGVEERAASVAHDSHFRDWWATYLRMGASPGAALALTRMNSEIDVRPVLSHVRVPTLVLHRTEDRCLSIDEGRYTASLIPGARFVELPGIDHLPFVGDQDAVLDRIEAFVLGSRIRPEVDRVLATVLAARFFAPGESRSRVLNAQSEETGRLLASDLKREIEWFRGREAKLGKESSLAIFDGPTRAVRCACTLAERASWLGFQTAIGLHTGECDFTNAEIGGSASEIAARLCDAAKPGEILVSSTLRDLAAGSGIQWEEKEPTARLGLPQDPRLFNVRRPCGSPELSLPPISKKSPLE